MLAKVFRVMLQRLNPTVNGVQGAIANLDGAVDASVVRYRSFHGTQRALRCASKSAYSLQHAHNYSQLSISASSLYTPRISLGILNMTRSETDGDIECAMLTTHEDAPLPTRIGKRRACSEVDELKAGLVALFLAYLGACGAAYALGRHIAGFLLESWFLGTPVSRSTSNRLLMASYNHRNLACEGLLTLISPY
jgi:hypothetical protein